MWLIEYLPAHKNVAVAPCLIFVSKMNAYDHLIPGARGLFLW